MVTIFSKGLDEKLILLLRNTLGPISGDGDSIGVALCQLCNIIILGSGGNGTNIVLRIMLTLWTHNPDISVRH